MKTRSEDRPARPRRGSGRKRRSSGDTGAGGAEAPPATELERHLASKALLPEACERICGLAARLVDAPSVLVTLTEGGRQPYLIASHGLEAAGGMWGLTPLSLSLATHSGARGEPLLIEDVRRHDLLAEDPLHQAHGFRSFLALPLSVGTETLGTICALDTRPRAWTDEEVGMLGDLAESVVTEVRLRGSLRLVRAVEAATSRAERQSFVTLVDGLDAIVTERDATSRTFRFVSRKAEDLLGHPVERWLEEPDFWMETVLHPDDRQRVSAALADPPEPGASHVLEYRMVTLAGEALYFRDHIRATAADPEDGPLLRGVMIDITEQKRSADELRRKNDALVLVHDLAHLASDEEGDRDALQAALERVARHGGWAAGHVYLRAGDGLEPSGMWFLERPEQGAAFRRATESRPFDPGEGLPGRVLASLKPVWVSNLADSDDFPRIRAATEAGLLSGFGFPALTGRTVEAVFEFYGERVRDPDEELLGLAEQLGAILGRVLERRRSQASLRVAEERARMTVEKAREAFIAMRPDGTVQEWNPAAERTFGWSREEALGRPLHELIIPPKFREAHLAGIERYRATGEGPVLGRIFEIEGLHKDGSEIPVELSITPLEVGDELVFNAFLRDISERRHEEEEARRRERLLAQAQRLARLGSWEWDVENDEIHWSDELHRIFGTDPQTFKPDLDEYLRQIHPEDRDLAETVISAAMETHEDFTFEHRVVHPDGKVRVVLSQGRVDSAEDGGIRRMTGTAQDITDRKALETKERQLVAEQAAREQAESSEDRVKEILESITDAFFALDREWRFTYVNREAERILRRSADELLGTDVREHFDGRTGAAFEDKFRRALESNEMLEFEEYLASRERWVEVRAYPSERGLSVYFHDITERREAEARVRSSESRYRFLSDSIPQHVWTATPDGGLEYMNRVMEEYLGLEVEEAEHGLASLIQEDDVDRFETAWRAALESGEPLDLETRLRRQDGAYRWHLIRARAQVAPDGEVIRWFGTNTDIDDQKELERARDEAMDELERVTHLLSSERGDLEEYARELHRTARALERSNRELDQFAYVASHDLKAPLRGIANLAQWLAEDLSGNLTDETRDLIDLLEGRVHRMEALIDGILQYSRAGRGGDEPEQVDVGQLVQDVVEMLDPPEYFDMRISKYFPVLETERVPLQQVFMNLIGNAVKHADGDRPMVKVTCSDEGHEFYEFSVSDNGPGIAPEFHERIWTIFQTLQARDQVEGTGIGLSVVKRTVERQGGQVWVESEEGEGATFRFLWPRNPRGEDGRFE